MAVVIGPFFVPAAVFALIRTGPEYAFVSNSTLSDVAFGVVAVAFAALTRAITGKGDSWKLVSAIGIGAIVFETGIATSRDSVAYSDRVVEYVENCPQLCDINALHDTITGIMERSPQPIHWIVVLFAGALLCSTAAYAIWSET